MRTWLWAAGIVVFITLLVDSAGNLLGDPFDGVYAVVQQRTGFDRGDLEFASGGYSRNLFGRSAGADFHIKGAAKEKTIRIKVWKPFYLLPWQVREFEDNS